MVTDELEVALEDLLESSMPRPEAGERLLQHGTDLRVRDGENSPHEKTGAGTGAGGYLFARQVRFGDDAARVVLESVGGQFDHRRLSATGPLVRSVRARAPRPPSP